MEKCLTIEDGVKNILKIFEKTPPAWELIPAQAGEYTDTLVLEGERYPLFWWRTDPQVDMMQELAPERKICSMKLNRVCPKSWGLETLLYKELDIAEPVWVKKHAVELSRYHRVKFLPADFIESVDFDWLEIEFTTL